MKMEYQPPLKW